MTGTEQLKKHERLMGYLKMAISLQLGTDRDVVEDVLHPMRGIGIRLLNDWSTGVTDFINES